jgi:hypothetical protein
MFLLDDILLLPLRLPVAGFNWVLRQVQTMADHELMNDQLWKERLIELQMRLELGEIGEEEFAAEEKIVFERLREIRMRREEAARAQAVSPDEGPEIEIHTGYGE